MRTNATTRPAVRRLAAWVVVLASWTFAAGRGAAQSDAVPPALLAEARAHVLAAQWDAAEVSYTRVLALSPDTVDRLVVPGLPSSPLEEGRPRPARF